MFFSNIYPEKKLNLLFVQILSRHLYENEDDATRDLAKFSLANAIYATLLKVMLVNTVLGTTTSDFIYHSTLVLSSRTGMDNARTPRT